MKARKIAIMLAITVVTVLALFVISLIDNTAFGATPPLETAGQAIPDTVAFLRQNIIIGSDGNASVEVLAVLGKGGSGDLLLPFPFEECHDFAILSGPIIFAPNAAGQAMPCRALLGYRMLNLETTPEAAPGDTVMVTAQVPDWFDREESRQEYGEFSLGIAYVNTSRWVLRKFELGLELPAGMLVHSVTRVIPAYDPKKSPEPPYALGGNGDRGWAVLRQGNLAPAGSCRLDLHIRPARRGPLPLVVGVIAAILYLIFFRDVLKAKETE